MNEEIRKVLESVRDGSMTVEEALLRLKIQPFEDLGFAKSIFTVPCARALRKSYTVRAKQPNRSSGLSGPCRRTGRSRC